LNLYTFQLYTSASQLPAQWNSLAVETVFLNTAYLEVLEKSAPTNMTCHFIGLFDSETLIGVALSQFLDLNQLESFGERDQCVKTYIRNFAFRNFASHVLFIGNNMLTGQHAFAFSKECNISMALQTLSEATNELKTIFKSRKTKKWRITREKQIQSCD
jgi:hypothetical protein